jgi:hypothetical protein
LLWSLPHDNNSEDCPRNRGAQHLNSPIDADKIDYLHRDSLFLQQHTTWPVTTRLSPGPQISIRHLDRFWLTDFLSDQYVNHYGLLCLSGRSAVAAADLLRERIFLHDRFYLSPEIRVAERMAFEIIQQFLIRAVMSDAFLQTLKLETTVNYAADITKQPSDPIEIKSRVVATMLTELSETQATGIDREFGILTFMYEKLKTEKRMHTDYHSDILDKCYACLKALSQQQQTSLSAPSPLIELVDRTLVREPLVFRREDYARVRELLRLVQHKYFGEILLDIARLPRVLAVPRRWRSSLVKKNGDEIDYGILVPEGPVSSWGPGSKARVPLTDGAVKQLERPYGRVLVIAPQGNGTAKANYIWDRVRAVLLEAGVPLCSTTPEEVG